MKNYVLLFFSWTYHQYKGIWQPCHLLIPSSRYIFLHAWDLGSGLPKNDMIREGKNFPSYIQLRVASEEIGFDLCTEPSDGWREETGVIQHTGKPNRSAAATVVDGSISNLFQTTFVVAPGPRRSFSTSPKANIFR